MAPTGDSRLLTNVTQPLVLGIHHLEDRSVLEDPIPRYRRAELEKAFKSATKGKRRGQDETLAHVQERWSTIWEFQVESVRRRTLQRKTRSSSPGVRSGSHAKSCQPSIEGSTGVGLGFSH